MLDTTLRRPWRDSRRLSRDLMPSPTDEAVRPFPFRFLFLGFGGTHILFRFEFLFERLDLFFQFLGEIPQLQNFFPQPLSIFALPRPFYHLSEFTYESRGAGAFTNPNAAACVLGSSILLSMTAMRLHRRALMKAFIYAIIVVLLVGVLSAGGLESGFGPRRFDRPGMCGPLRRNDRRSRAEAEEISARAPPLGR